VIDLESLNENQKRAVLTPAHYVRIIAGAGSGKTRVLTTRIAYLVEQLGVFGSQILAITFTNKAAREMKERIALMLGDDAHPIHISTIHSLCVRILREDIFHLNYPRNFTVLDQEDQKQVLKEAYRELNVDRTKISFSSMLDYIANNKYVRISRERALELAGNFFGEKDKARVYAYYLNRLEAMQGLDFDDLLLFAVDLFAQFPDCLAKWQRRFHYIHVDEFQDIDKVQYQLIRQLAGDTNDVYVVGDPDQTIYTWRGADVNIILGFEKDFLGAETIILNENYRSTAPILNGANSLIAHNDKRVEKDLFTQRTDGALIVHHSAQSEDQESYWVSSKIKELKQDGIDYKDIAVLYRSNYLSRSIEKGLLEGKIPYVIYGGTRFYERAEVKDALCYLRMLEMADDLALVRVINNPRRGVGDKSLDKLRVLAREKNQTMYETLKTSEDLFSGAIGRSTKEFVEMIEKVKAAKGSVTISRLLELILEASGYQQMLKENKEEERMENLKELLNDIETFQTTYPDGSLEEYLQLVSLYGDRNEYMEGTYVSLMTIHAAKGLEFDTVFVVGLSEGIFPNERALNDGKRGLEEERRLAYVAYTRAKRQLYLCESSGFSQILSRVRTRSRFINEIEKGTIEHIGTTFETGKPHEFKMAEALFDAPMPFAQRFKQAAKGRRLKKNDIVVHTVYGEGVVLKAEEGLVEVAFEYPHGIRKIMANHPSIQLKKDQENDQDEN